MSYSEPARIAIHRTRIRWIRVAGLLVVDAAIASLLGRQLPASSSSTVASPIHALHGELRDLRREHRGALGEADGAVPDGTTVEAARWVATPTTSAHVSGDAVDVGPSDAAAWLSEHGAAYGLCRIYGNEPWHYELRAQATAQGCPPTYADPTQDPRMQR